MQKVGRGVALALARARATTAGRATQVCSSSSSSSFKVDGCCWRRSSAPFGRRGLTTTTTTKASAGGPKESGGTPASSGESGGRRGFGTLTTAALTAGAAAAALRLVDAPWAEDVEFAAYGAMTPILRMLDAETSHNLGIAALAMGLAPRARREDAEALSVRAFGMRFSNPVGLAAGFDKDAKAFKALLDMGFGFVEIGSVTPKPQPGNPKPRAFRLQEHGAVINRYGFNSEGHDSAKSRLSAYRSSGEDAKRRGLLGVNLGKNKTTPEENAADDYVVGVENIGEYGDYIVVNISSPNTPGLRNLQGRKHLSGLLRKVLTARSATPATKNKPVLVKIAPDLTDAALKDIASVIKSEKVDGVIVSNTTIARPDAIKAHAHGEEAGGLSGRPLMEPSTKVLHDLYKLTGGKITLVGCGGVASGEDVYRKIRAGASLVQLYTAFAYEGPPLIPRIKRELEECLKRDGFDSVEQAIGAAHRK
jgi:dihydroorotate dehydrogenase